MNTHVAEVFPKSGLKPRASCGIQRNSGGTKNIRDSNLRALENVFWPRNVRLLHRPASGLRRFQEQIDSAIKCASAHILVRRRGFALSKVLRFVCVDELSIRDTRVPCHLIERLGSFQGKRHIECICSRRGGMAYEAATNVRMPVQILLLALGK